MPKFNNEDNIVMLIKLNDAIIENKRLVAYFLAAPKDDKSYSFKNRFKYKVKNDILYAKSKSSKLMIYKENGVNIDYKRLKDTELKFREFTIHIIPNGEEKTPGVFSKLIRSLGCSHSYRFDKVESFDSISEFSNNIEGSRFNKTKFHF